MTSVSAPLSPPPSPHPPPVPLASVSSLTCCPELDLSVTLSPAPKVGRTCIDPRASSQGHRPRLESLPRKQTGRRADTQRCVQGPVTVTVRPEPHVAPSRAVPPQQPVKSQRGRRRSKPGRAPAHSAVPPVASSNRQPGCLEKAELNTTLALKAELQSIKGAEFDSHKAVEETLQRSERTKNLINTRATEVVNVARSQVLFTSLVSVDVQEDQLLSRVLHDRLHLAPPPRSQASSVTECPSLLTFLTPDLLRQKPLPAEEEPINSRPRPVPRPAHATFDLYRRQRRWEATP